MAFAGSLHRFCHPTSSAFAVRLHLAAQPDYSLYLLIAAGNHHLAHMQKPY